MRRSRRTPRVELIVALIWHLKSHKTLQCTPTRMGRRAEVEMSSKGNGRVIRLLLLKEWSAPASETKIGAELGARVQN
jgi:hypothetical protein